MFAWTIRPELRSCERPQTKETVMPAIRVIHEDEATGALSEIYARIRSERGNIANIHRIHSLFPEALEAHMDLYRVLMFREERELSRVDAELIATVVSIENSCDYCALHHGDALAVQSELQGTPCPIPSHSHDDWQPDHRQLAILELATKLSQTPQAVDERDIQKVRQVGITDRGILEIVLITSYFCFVNRIALGLGVTTSQEERQGFHY
jgi:uncharacterized peroxidase-related enzyme